MQAMNAKSSGEDQYKKGYTIKYSIYGTHCMTQTHIKQTTYDTK